MPNRAERRHPNGAQPEPPALPEPKPWNEVYMYLTTDQRGVEGLPVLAVRDGTLITLVQPSLEEAVGQKPIIDEILKMGVPLTLWRYSQREQLEHFSPLSTPGQRLALPDGQELSPTELELIRRHRAAEGGD